MLGNGIKQASATIGTGNLTLSAVTGYPKLSDVFPLNFPISYGLLDSNGLLIEEGIGHLVDATTFVRATVTATYSGGVYAGGPASASALSAVSLTGTTTLICTPNAATIESMMPTVDNVSAGVSRYLTSAGRNSNNTTVNPPNLRVNYVPFLLRTAARVTSLAIQVGGGVAGTARAGLYSVGENGYPGVLLATTGDLDTTTSGLKSGSVGPLSLPAGWYFVASVFSAGPSVAAYTAGAGNIFGGGPLGLASGGVTPVDYRSETVATAVLPATPSGSTSASASANHIPMVLLGVQ